MQEQRGFTLIELLITLAVLSFGLLGLAGLQVQLVRANSFNSNMTIATAIGSDLLEEAKFEGLFKLNDPTEINNPSAPVPYGDIDGDGNLDVSDVDIDNDGTPDDPYNGRFTWTRELNCYPNTTSPIFCEVDVTVFWTDTIVHQLDFRTVVQ